MFKLRILAIIMMGLVLALVTVVPPHSAARPTLANVPSVVANIALSGSDAPSDKAGKFPRVDALGSTVHMVSNPNGDADYWTKTDTSNSSGSPTNLGSVGGGTTYANASIAVALDGTAYAIWIVQNVGINIQSKPANGGWSSSRAVYRSGSFLSFADIAVSSSGQLLVAWNESSAYRYRTSSDGGVNWSGTALVTSKTPRGPIRVAGGPNGSFAAAFASNVGHVHVALWTGSGFNTIDLTPSLSSGDFFADPSATIAPNGKVYVAWRNAPGGLYYTEQQSNGTWPVSRLVGGQVYSQVGISADASNNLHIAWAGDPAGQWDVWYAFKPASGDWQGPIEVTDGGLYVADPDLASTIGANAYGHVVYEGFAGSNTTDRYALFSSIAVNIGAQPVIESGATTTNKNPVSVAFNPVQGTPTQLRWRWNAVPTDAANDSSGWQAFTNPKSIPLPSSPSVCQALTLYTQTKDGTAIEPTAKTAVIKFDNAVQVTDKIVNPFLAGLPQTFAHLADVSTQPSDGAYDGDASYTRIPQFFLGIYDAGDCSGLASFSVPASSVSGPISGGKYENKIALPQAAIQNPGVAQAIGLSVQDTLLNSFTDLKDLIYDPSDTDPSTTVTNTDGLPVRHSGTAGVDSVNSILRTLTFSDTNVTDNVYGPKEGLPSTKQFWGVWIANSATPVGATNTSLKWYPVRVANQSSNPFTVKWNIFAGLNIGPDRTKPSTYYVYVRFLDGAGNASLASNAITIPVTITAGYTIPVNYLGLVGR